MGTYGLGVGMGVVMVWMWKRFCLLAVMKDVTAIKIAVIFTGYYVHLRRTMTMHGTGSLLVALMPHFQCK